MATTIFWSTTTTETPAQAAGDGGVRGSRGTRSEGPHHHQQDFDYTPTARAAYTGILNESSLCIHDIFLLLYPDSKTKLNELCLFN